MTPGIPFVISAPSGTGKTTVCRALLERDPKLGLSVSHTTRKPRDGERDGVDYHFVDESAFEKLVDEDAFLEWARYAGRLYGTSWGAVAGPLAEGIDLLLEIEVQGATQVKERRDDACLIFLLPPSMEVLELRLRGRGSDSQEEIARRLGEARGEIEIARIFDYAIVNDELERTIDAVLGILEIERSRDADAISCLRERCGSAPVLQRWLQLGGAA